MKNGLGRVYDLDSLFERLNRLYFDGNLKAHIRWSSRTARKAKRRILLGSYNPKTNIITMSRRLDHPNIPLFFVEHILFHEMLHAVFPSEKHKMHTEKFKKFERMHPDFDRALAWEKASSHLLFNPKNQVELPFGLSKILSKPMF